MSANPSLPANLTRMISKPSAILCLSSLLLLSYCLLSQYNYLRGVGTAAAAAAMAAAHSRPRKRVGQLYSINAHAQVYDFPAGLESKRIQYFKTRVFQEVQ